MDTETDVKCKLCGGKLIIGACATECTGCGASVHPDTGEPFKSDGKVVKVGQFGGRHIP